MAKRVLVSEIFSDKKHNLKPICELILFFFFQNVGNPYKFIPPGIFDTGLASKLPKAYQKFYYEWKEEPTPVHFIPKAGKYERNDETGEVKPIQNVPLPLRFPHEFDKCLLGGEAVIKGYYKTRPTVRRFPHFWVPTLKRTAVYSEILNQHMDVLATDRVIQLIHHYKGFDEYIMQVSESVKVIFYF